MISVVIPVYDEDKALPATLTHLIAQEGDYEIIAVDGCSTDSTLEVLSKFPEVRVLMATKGRASQMNTGAAAAKGEWLLFLHADTLLPEGALARLNSWEADSGIHAGGFRHRFSGDSCSLRFVSWLDNVRTQTTRIIYGDQAMFVRRSLFQRLGGFPEGGVMEDVSFCQRLVHETRPILVDDSVVTDSRKFEQMGVWRSLFRVAVILVRHQLGLSIEGNCFFSDVR